MCAVWLTSHIPKFALLTSKTLSIVKYRSEIDGLRAVAVLPVILYHGGFSVFSGGFVGVDVFFVISGYLITSIILNERANDSFSLLRFYERRARRILPALFFVMLCCVPFAWIWMFPLDLKDFAQSMVATTAFLSNIHFWLESGYFEIASETKPLLHTWSLAVEEQYYVLFPLFVLLMWRFGRRWLFLSILAIAVASLLLSEWGWRYLPTGNFYLAPTRAWELLAGSICAFVHFRNEQKRNEPLAVIGLGLILFAIFYYDDSVPFPSLYALAPVVGTALIILFGPNGTWTARLLSTGPFVGIGLISYSAYLWHQPLFAFARIRSLHEPPQALMLALAVASLALAYLSWRYVELPFRRKRGRLLPTKQKVFATAFVASSVFIAAGISGHKAEGFPGRSEIGMKLADNNGLGIQCNGNTELTDSCATGANPNVLVWGDSFAMHLIDALVASNPQIKLLQMTKASCVPAIGIATVVDDTTYRAQDCISFNQRVIDWLSNQENSIQYVIISSTFYNFYNGENHLISENKLVPPSNDLPRIKFRETLQEIRNLNITPIIISPPPRTGAEIGRCLAFMAREHAEMSACDFKRTEVSPMHRKAVTFLKKLSSDVKVIWLEDYICNDEICHAYMNEKFVYRDAEHLAREGAAMLGKIMRLQEHFVQAPGQRPLERSAGPSRTKLPLKEVRLH